MGYNFMSLMLNLLLLALSVVLKRFLVYRMKIKQMDSTLVEMWRNGAIIVSSILLLISVYRIVKSSMF